MPFFAFLCFSSIQAQHEWTPAKVILKNDSSFRGLVKLPKHSGLVSIGSTKFKYKKNRKAKTRKLGHETVEEIIFGVEQFATVHYKYVPIKKNKYVLMELMVSGKASLYLRNVSNYHIASVPDSNAIQTGYYYDSTQYFFIRDNELMAKLVAGPNSYRGFIILAKKYFSDCEKIVDYLEHELYDLSNIDELVEDYNLICE